MDSIKPHDILSLLENYNALIKYHIKAHKESVSDERKINLNLDNIPLYIRCKKKKVYEKFERGKLHSK